MEQQNLRQKLKKKIRKISELQPNWDGAGSSGGRDYPVEASYRFLEIIPNDILENLEIFPTYRNSIQFEIEDEGIYVEAEIYRNKKISCLRVIDRNYQSGLATDFSWERRDSAVKLLISTADMISLRKKNKKK